MAYVARSQAPTYNLNATNNGQSITITNEGAFLYDDGGLSGTYTAGKDFSITFCGTCQLNSYRMGFYFNSFDIHETDTIFIYDGTSTSDRLIMKANNSNSLLNKRVYPTTNNSTGCLTVRFKTNDDNNVGEGFEMNVICGYPCENSYPVIEDTYYKVVDGRNIPLQTKFTYDIDTTETGEIDSLAYKTIDICKFDSIVLKAHGVYATDFGYYTGDDPTTLFQWSFTPSDSLHGTGATEAGFRYNEVRCYTVNLMITDKKRCASTQLEQVRVRVAQNPIKTIYPLRTICNSVSLPIDVGYSVNSTINVSKIEFKNEATATNWVRTFIPDGPYCAVQCYQAPVTFNQFPSGKKLESKEDICSICVNMEHEYMGDISIAIVCPNGSQAILKAQPSGTCGGGGGKFLGLPYGGNSHHTWDGSTSTTSRLHPPLTEACDSSYNPYGVGWNYCWSLNSDYDNSRGCLNNGTSVNVTHNFATIPQGFVSPNGSGPAGTQTFSTTDSSDYLNKSGYYVPTDDFSSLVGCPLNGQWAIEICDQWGSDNGWVFSWSMDLCNIQISDCEYQVGIDTIIWSPSQGVKMDILSGSQARIYTPDSAGTFPVGIRIVDEFGCVWDTNTSITTVWNPQPNLGSDRTICDVEQVRLDAGDAHSHLPTYSFVWEPTFDTTQVILTPAFTGQTTTYEVEVTNHDEGIYCRTRDTVVITVSPQPTANFETNVYPIEGCSPFMLEVNNTSMNATRYRWEFGDGIISTEASPTHVYAPGEYRLKMFAITENGCQDSLIYPELVRVYDKPRAEFGWNPSFPQAQNPTVKLINKTTPDLPDYRYFWEVQYDKNEDVTVTTLDAKDTTYTWEGDFEELPGEYLVKLIAFVNNVSPTGNVVECRDTAAHKIQIVNDFLQFPNAVTPNGDGINDVFEIKNLLDGGGFPTFELSIYDAMGKRVYYKKNITDPSEFWDPSDLPTGTYFYHFIGKGHNGDVQRSGAVQVLK